MTEHVLHLLGPFDIPHVGPRHVRVYAPPRPRGAHGPRPALFMFDGQNLFHDEPSYAGGWHLHRTACRLAERGLHAPVIIGIDHGGAARIDELSPWPTKFGGGRLDALLDWISGSLAPRVRADFGVAEAPEHVGVGGSSMGGLAAVYAHFRHPDRFGLALAMSPSLFLASGRVFSFVAGQPKPWRSRIYLDAGMLEARGALVASATRLADDLRARGWDDASLRLVVSKRGAHSEKHWRRRAPAAITFLFAGASPLRKRASGKR